MKSRLGAWVQGFKSKLTSVSSRDGNTTKAGVCGRVRSHCLAFTSVALTWDSFHFQVCDRSQAVLISEIKRFIEPRSHIISDGMASYQRLPEYGYVYDVIIHDKKFVKSEDTAIHMQNIKIRNKAALRSFKSNWPLNSYCSEYTYRLVLVCSYVWS